MSAYASPVSIGIATIASLVCGMFAGKGVAGGNGLGQFPDSFIARIARVQPLTLLDDLDPPPLPPPVFAPPST
jgi:hypothetical protein